MLKTLVYSGCLVLLLLKTGTASSEPGWEERRLEAWQALIAHNQAGSELARVRRVNEFMNQMRYVEDRVNWGTPDYWATPREFVAANGGDCEDFAIAKYFTLRTMGIPDRRLKMVYAVSRPRGESHMVLYYYPRNRPTPLVLDNRENRLLQAVARTDLHPVYSFNRQGYWLSGTDGSQHYMGAPDKLSRWRNLLQRRGSEGPRNM